MSPKTFDSQILNDIYQIRRDLHTIPEPSLHETKTKAYLIDYLSHLEGIQIVDRGAWFYAYYQGSEDENSIAFRADFDAVAIDSNSPAGHYCGHDGHASVLAGFARYLSETRPARSAYLIFQPAEEIGKGAVLCRELLNEKPISEIYGFHNIPGYPKGTILLLPGTFACASTGLEIRITGTPSHAAYPDAGKNPSEIIARLILMKNLLLAPANTQNTFANALQAPANTQNTFANALQAPANAQNTFANALHAPENSLPTSENKLPISENMSLDPANLPDTFAAKGQFSFSGLVLVTVIGVEIGGESYGVSPGEGTLRLTIRAEKEQDFRTIVKFFIDQAQQLARENQMTCTCRRIEEFPATENHPEQLARVKAAALASGLKTETPSEPFRWSEDFGYYLQTTPGAFFGVGSGTDCPQLHTKDYEYPDEISEAVLKMYVSLMEWT